MNKNFFSKILIAVFLIGLVGCQAKPNEDFFNSTEKLSGELFIETLYEERIFTVFAKSFMKENPGVKINIVENEEDIVNYSKRIATEIMSESVNAIVDINFVNKYKYADSDYFYDINEFMEKDSEFNSEDYYEKIFDSLEINEKLYFLPINISLTSYRINKKLAKMIDFEYEGKESITTYELIDLLEKLNNIDTSYRFTNNPNYKNMFEEYELFNYLDYEKKEAYFNTQEYKNYIEKIEKISEDNLSEDIPLEYVGRMLPITEEDYKNCLFVKEDLSNYEITLLSEETEFFSLPLILENSKNQRPFRVLGLYAIPKTIENPRLAWEFLEYCIKKIEYSKYAKEDWFYLTDIRPVNINNSIYVLDKSSTTIDNIDYTKIWMDNAMSSIDFLTFLDSDFSASIKMIQDEYFRYENISKKEYIEKMQNTAQIYLKE